jgi:citrate lyase subunit beta/citryl-CoA lyase
MWSIHPAQIRPIVAAFQPRADEVDTAIEILDAAARAGWAPIRSGQVLHDRASYRYFWHVLVRASRAAEGLPTDIRQRYFGGTHAAP